MTGIKRLTPLVTGLGGFGEADGPAGFGVELELEPDGLAGLGDSRCSSSAAWGSPPVSTRSGALAGAALLPAGAPDSVDTVTILDSAAWRCVCRQR